MNVETARQRLQNAENRVSRIRDQIKSLQVSLDIAIEKSFDASVELQRAEAAADSNAYPVGTRVRHAVFTDIKGTVVKSNGDGVNVLQDGAAGPGGGYTAREWVVIE